MLVLNLPEILGSEGCLWDPYEEGIFWGRKEAKDLIKCLLHKGRTLLKSYVRCCWLQCFC